MARTPRTPTQRDPNEARAPRGRHDGRLDSECWCRRKTVPVEPADLKAGRTESCGRPWCTPPIGVVR